MSKYVKYNGKLYKAVDGWADDAKKCEQVAAKLSKEVMKLRVTAAKCKKLAEQTGAFVAVPKRFEAAEEALINAEHSIGVAKAQFADVLK